MSGSVRPKALVLASRNTYINPTEEVVLDALGEIFELTFYGPGYRSLDDLREDVGFVFEKEGPFSVAFMQQYLWHYYFSGPEGMLELADNQHASFDVPDFVRRFPKFGRGFVDLPCPKVFIGLRTDTYWFPEEHFREFEAFPGTLITWPAEVICPMNQMTGLESERFAENVSDRYLDFCREYTERIIPFAHVVDDGEFVYKTLSRRRRPVCVPGQPYARRKEAVDCLTEAGIALDTIDPIQRRIESIWSYVGSPLFRHKWGIRLMQHGFRRLLSTSLVAYTDGSRIRFPVRKYFEIPAAGALLSADPFYGDRELGFEAGVNYISCQPSELAEIVRYAQANLGWASSIASAAQDVVKRCHSRTACVANFRRIWSQIVDGTYRGANWRNGSLVMNAPETVGEPIVTTDSTVAQENNT